MKRTVIPEVLCVLLFLAGCFAYPAFAEGAAVVIQPAAVVVQPQPVVVQPVVVQPRPVVVQPQPVVVEPQPVAVQPATVVVQPYTVIEGSTKILVDPEDYYYQDKGVYYHHNYQSDKDVVVETVPSEYRFVRSKIDITTVPQKHFRHPKVVEKSETIKTQVNPESGTEIVEKKTTTTSKE